jgi:hypothetical protein
MRLALGGRSGPCGTAEISTAKPSASSQPASSSITARLLVSSLAELQLTDGAATSACSIPKRSGTLGEFMAAGPVHE